MNARLHPRPPHLTHTAIHVLGANPSSEHLHAVTSLQGWAQAWGKSMKPLESGSTSQDPHNCLWAWIMPYLLLLACTTGLTYASCSGYAPAYLQADCNHWAPTQYKCLWGDCAAMEDHADSQGLCSCLWANSWPQLLLPSLASISMFVFTSSPCPYMVTCCWPNSRKCVHHWLWQPLWLPALAPSHKVPLKVPSDLAAIEVPPNDLAKDYKVVKLWTAETWAKETLHSRGCIVATHTHPWLPTPLDLGSQHAPIAWATEESLSLIKSVQKSGRGGCFFKCADTYMRLQGFRRIREIWVHQHNTVNLQ